MWQYLLKIEPRFQPHRDAFLEEWGQDGPPFPEYICISSLVIFTIEAYTRGELSIVQRIMDIVDHWIKTGDKDVVELAVVGYIEDLSNGNLHNKTKPADFEQFMSVEMKAEWDAMIDAWSRPYKQPS